MGPVLVPGPVVALVAPRGDGCSHDVQSVVHSLAFQALSRQGAVVMGGCTYTAHHVRLITSA